MKVKIISRNPDEYLRETKNDIHKVQRNYDPSLHPFETTREYVRAMNATKLERVFAKPFIGDLSGHNDGIFSFAKHPERLSQLCSGAFDGEIRIWDLPTRKCLRNFTAHVGFVRGISYYPDGSNFISVSNDKTIKTWSSKIPDIGEDEEPLNTILTRNIISGITHHRNERIFATSGDCCQLWEQTRNEPLKTLEWGVDTIHALAFNPVQTSLLGACASDRSIILYDKREKNPIRKVVLTMRSNRLCWNPMEAFIFTVANEDHNLYTFDTRKLRQALKVYKGHVDAVTDIDYCPTGKEFVSAGYDKTIRLFTAEKGFSRDIYHTKRMQHVICVGWSLDNKYVFSGSDEMNIRLWKARASEKLGPLRPREKAAFNYNEALKEKYAAHPQIKRIANHRSVPNHVYSKTKAHQQSKDKIKRKEANRKVHSGDTSNYASEKHKHIVKEYE